MISVVILTYNEEIHIARAIASVQTFADEIWVVDSHSTDRTQAIAKSAGARVVEHPFSNQAAQLNWALDSLPIQGEWLMRLDADEVISSELAQELNDRLAELPPDVHGVELNRKHIFMGRWIRHGGRFPMKLLRVWRNGSARSEERWMDEHMVLNAGRSVIFQGTFSDWNLNSLSYFIAKHNSYATREAVQVVGERHGIFGKGERATRQAGSKQAMQKKWLKEHVYNRIPFPVSSSAYFLLRYVLQLGFLDGIEGLIYHVLQGFWYRFLVGCSVLEFERALSDCADTDEIRRKLAKLSGLSIQFSVPPRYATKADATVTPPKQ